MQERQHAFGGWRPGVVVLQVVRNVKAAEETALALADDSRRFVICRCPPSSGSTADKFHSSAVGEHFGRPLRELSRIVAHGDDGIRPFFCGMLYHALIGFLSG